MYCTCDVQEFPMEASRRDLLGVSSCQVLQWRLQDGLHASWDAIRISEQTSCQQNCMRSIHSFKQQILRRENLGGIGHSLIYVCASQVEKQANVRGSRVLYVYLN